MIYNIYSIFDRITSQFSEPWLSLNNEVAIRKFNYLMLNAPMVSADCSLYKLAEFSTDSGDIIQVTKPEFICNYVGGQSDV